MSLFINYCHVARDYIQKGIFKTTSNFQREKNLSSKYNLLKQKDHVAIFPFPIADILLQKLMSDNIDGSGR